jgi:hypothetical protein
MAVIWSIVQTDRETTNGGVIPPIGQLVIQKQLEVVRMQ